MLALCMCMCISMPLLMKPRSRTEQKSATVNTLCARGGRDGVDVRSKPKPTCETYIASVSCFLEFSPYSLLLSAYHITFSLCACAFFRLPSFNRVFPSGTNKASKRETRIKYASRETIVCECANRRGYALEIYENPIKILAALSAIAYEKQREDSAFDDGTICLV